MEPRRQSRLTKRQLSKLLDSVRITPRRRRELEEDVAADVAALRRRVNEPHPRETRQWFIERPFVQFEAILRRYHDLGLFRVVPKSSPRGRRPELTREPAGAPGRPERELAEHVAMIACWVWSLLLIALSSSACIVRPGMNWDCSWPPEASRPLDLTNGADRRHLILDAEVVEELVDRYRFHQPNDQPACEKRLIEVVARTHSVNVSDLARAHDHIPERGLNLPVNVPVGVLFILAVLGVVGRIERRFADEPLPTIVTLVVASVALSALFVLVGELWTSVLQMIRVGSQHVGGRVARLPWKRHEPQILVIGIVAFWIVFSLRRVFARKTIGAR